MLRTLPFFAVFGLGLLFQGCEAPLPAVPPLEAPLTATDAWPQWLAIADAEPSQRDIEKAVGLASAMAETEAGLRPMVEYIGDAAVPAEKKIVAIICLSTLRQHLAAFEGPLREFTEVGHPEETRTIATHALGLLDTPGAMEAMKQLLDDRQQAVRESALGVLLSFHPEMVTERLQAFWDDPETSASIRDQVVTGMPPHLVQPFIAIYCSAVSDARLTVVARLKAVSVLGQLGGPEHLAVLKECVDNDPDESVREQARGALALLQAASGLEPAAAGQGGLASPQPAASGPPA